MGLGDMKLYLIIGAGVAVLGLLAFSHVKAYQAGRTAEQAAVAAQINQENEHAGNTAEDWRARLRRCVDAGRVFSFESGSCDR